MSGSQLNLLSLNVILCKVLARHMSSTYGHAEIRKSGSMWMGHKFYPLSMRRKWAGPRNLEGNNLMKFKEKMGQKCQSMEWLCIAGIVDQTSTTKQHVSSRHKAWGLNNQHKDHQLSGSRGGYWTFSPWYGIISGWKFSANVANDFNNAEPNDSRGNFSPPTILILQLSNTDYVLRHITGIHYYQTVSKSWTSTWFRVCQV